jgi:transcriptional regulator with XRE-family HTH domain
MSTHAPAAPGPLPDGPPQPAAHPGTARTHVRRLRQDGSTYAGIATAAGLAPATVSGLAAGRRRPTRGTTAAVLAVTSGTVPRGRVDAGGTRLRLCALHVMGHGSARIARALGVRETAISELVRGDARTIRPRLRDAIADLYDAWWDKRAPERTRAERAAATAARRKAIAGNWCAAAALDDDQLDEPGYRPSQGWKPATGTGVAPEIPPPARDRRHRKARR